MEAEMIFSAYEREMQSRGVTPSAMSDYRITASAFMDFLRRQRLDVERIRRADIQEFFAQTEWAPSTQHARLTYVRAPILYAEEELDADVRWPKRIRLERVEQKEPRIISNAILREIKRQLDSPAEWALFHVLAYSGLRRFEVCALKWMDISFAEQTLTVEKGKGRKQRTIPMHPELAKALKGLGLFAAGSVFVFPGRDGGQISLSGMDRKAHRMCGERDIQIHDFRRTVASSLENNDAREGAIHQILGWGTEGNIRLHHYTLISPRRMYAEILKLYREDPI